MENVWHVYACFCCCLFFFVSDDAMGVVAHPGRTDANGCHTCRTNCAKWGLSQGEYHCHNGGTSSGSGSSSNRSNSASTNYQQQLADQKAAEKLAKKQAAEEKKQKEAYIASEKSSGETDGYQYKMKHPDESIGSLSGTSEYYRESYQSGYAKADEQLTKETQEVADKNSAADATKLSKMNLNVPEGVKKELYLETYKEKFKEYEDNYRNSVKQDAKESAMIDAYDFNGKLDHTKEIEEKGRDIYQKTYDTNYDLYTKDIEESKDYVSGKGYDDGKTFQDKTDSSYEQFDDFKAYAEMQKIYDASYQEGRNMSLMIAGVALICVVAVGVSLFVRKRRKQRKA